MELNTLEPAETETELYEKFCRRRNIDKTLLESMKKFVFFGLWQREPVIQSFDNDSITALAGGFGLDMPYIRDTVCRLTELNKALDKFLHNPVISKDPLVVDIENYRQCLVPKLSLAVDRGYYTVMEIFTGNTAVIKKLNTGRFVRVSLNENIIRYVRKNDIINCIVSRDIFLNWELLYVYGYYPKEAINYI